MQQLPSFFYARGWKILCVLLLFYILIGGMLVPLGTGVLSISPSTIDVLGKTTFRVQTYNAHFNQFGNETRCWLKCKNDWIAIDSLTFTGANTFTFSLLLDSAILQALMSTHLDLLINNSYSGNVILRDAVVISNQHAHLTGRSNDKQFFSTPVVSQNKGKAFVFPFREILFESIRNTFYHVPMWFAMLFLISLSLIFSIRFLYRENSSDDLYASSFASVSLLFAACGIITGMIWAKHTWGAWWPNDPKLNGAAIGVAMYLAYAVLRNSISDEIKRARIAAVYNIFAFVIYILFIFILPRITDSLHPGNGGNPAFSKYDLDSHLRLFFYPAIIGWILLSLWISSLLIRIQKLENESI